MPILFATFIVGLFSAPVWGWIAVMLACMLPFTYIMWRAGEPADSYFSLTIRQAFLGVLGGGAGLFVRHFVLSPLFGW